VTERIESLNRARGECAKHLSAGNIHALRVAARRLQAALSIFRRRIGGRRVKEIRRALKPVMKAAGSVRNCDIAARFAREAGLGRLHRVRADIARARRRAAAELKRTILALPPIDNPPLRPGPARTLDEFYARFQQAGETANRKPTGSKLHALRIEGKRLRYALEILAPNDSLLERLRELQTVLGDLNDCVTVRKLFPCATLKPILDAGSRKARSKFQRIWPQFESIAK
jgi:CHAD domain-containing protein